MNNTEKIDKQFHFFYCLFLPSFPLGIYILTMSEKTYFFILMAFSIGFATVNCTICMQSQQQSNGTLAPDAVNITCPDGFFCYVNFFSLAENLI